MTLILFFRRMRCAFGAILLLSIGSSLAAAQTAPAKPPASGAPVTAMPDLSACTALSDPKAYEAKKISDGYFYIIRGQDGWLFRTKQDFVSDFKFHPAMKEKFKAVQNAFAAKGTDIIFVLLPTRGIVAGDMVIPGNPLAEGYDPKVAAQNYAAALADARSYGLNVVGITKYVGNDKFFFRTDHHWTPGGAVQMAREIAAFARTLPSYAKLSKSAFSTGEKGPETFESTFQEPIEDLCGVKLPDAKNTIFETSPLRVNNEKDLFGDSPAPQVVLVGTSNSNPDRFHPNFDGFLKEFLETDIINAAITGGGLDDSLLSYLGGEEYAKNPPKLIIWEIPGYYTFSSENSQKPVFDQVVPSILGNCSDKALVSSGPVSLNAPSLPLFSGLSAKPLKGQNLYFALEFSSPVKKAKFTLFFRNTANKEIHKIKFKRSERFPVDGSFFYTFQPSKIEDTDSISIDVPENLRGGRVEARICPVPR
jgi:alginate biosynthesis protein AlgX